MPEVAKPSPSPYDATNWQKSQAEPHAAPDEAKANVLADPRAALNEAKANAVATLVRNGMDQARAERKVENLLTELGKATQKCGDPKQNAPENVQECGIVAALRSAKLAVGMTPSANVPPARKGDILADGWPSLTGELGSQAGQSGDAFAKEQHAKEADVVKAFNPEQGDSTTFVVGVSWDTSTKP